MVLAKSLNWVAPSRARSFAEMTEIDCGTSINRSERFSAVTTISSRFAAPLSPSAGGGAASPIDARAELAREEANTGDPELSSDVVGARATATV